MLQGMKLLPATAFALPLLAFGDEIRVERDIPYAEPKNVRQSLDVHAPAKGRKRPVVVWVHGGGWMRGSKEEVDRKPAAFVERGFVFVSINYRFFPNVAMGEIVRDTAKAVAWTHANASKYGGDPNRILLMGHSAGAQLAAIVCTNRKFLKEEGVKPSVLKGCVPVDGDTYDVPMQIRTAEERRKQLNQPPPKYGHREKFGTEEQHREYSAAYHTGRGKRIPPFLLLHVADHPDTTAQAKRLEKALQEAGVDARAYGASSTDHVKLDRDLGVPGDASSAELFAFVDRIAPPKSRR